MITLARGGLELDVSPEIGGAIARFAVDGTHVLRPAQPGVTDVREMSCFPLVPYANRIENAVLHFGGRTYDIPRNFGSHPHSLHGHGWRLPWRVESLSRDQVILGYDHGPDEWPWGYSAEEEYALDEGGLRVRLTLRSRDARPMPTSLGFHPYFPRTASTRVTSAVKGMWKTDATQIPTEYVAGTPPLDLMAGALVDKAPFVDNTFDGWRGPARIEQPDSGLELSLEASPACTFFHMFIPFGATFFCAEPVSAMPNAFNRPEAAAITGARTLAPGGTFSIEMRLGVARK
ncbi:MAG: aldose 1-epimerase [Alphaproteobacteria bacterium]|nr:aldose 1-epimerase [Alphaproteobacteria bacterium]